MLTFTKVPFTLPKNRTRITGEPDGLGSQKHELNPGQDWIGFAHRGGGKVAEDIKWTTNPKQFQEEHGAGPLKNVIKPTEG
ncbi:MAG: hypothetical protein WBV82_13000 [Myxococcaceae bacterium]